MSQRTTPKQVAPEDIPEVVQFLEAKEKLDRMREAYPEIFQQLEEVKEEYNSTLQAAEQAVRGKGVTCGPFIHYQTQIKYDADKLYEAVGREAFLELGGQVKTVATFEIDKAKLEAQIAANKVPADVVKAVKEVSPRYKKPEKISI